MPKPYSQDLRDRVIDAVKIRDVGARLVFLPKYSPDLNPIEQVFAKFKTLLRKAGARSYEAISDACREILAQYPPAECAAYLKNAGYA